MYFQTSGFLIFVSVVYLLFFFFHKKTKETFWLFVVASFTFYAGFDFKYIFLLITISIIDFNLSRIIHKTNDLKKRKRILIASLFINIIILIFFKYRFFSSISFGFDLAIPFGISFYTYESMSYVIDVYKNELEPRKNLIEYVFFISFFPHLIAGPIIRPKDFFQTLGNKFILNRNNFNKGCFRFLIGLIKKVILADVLNSYWLDKIYTSPNGYHAFDVWLSMTGRATQIYFDMSGYTDMAIGVAAIFGIMLPENFASPFLAKNAQDFWRTWHMTLSFWFRDYVYKPIVKLRPTESMRHFAALLTMILVGVWHGVNIPQVSWGIVQGLMLFISKKISISRLFRIQGLKIATYLTTFLTYMFMALSTGLYSQHNIKNSLNFYSQAINWHINNSFKLKTPLWGMSIVILCIGLQFLSAKGYKKRLENFFEKSSIIYSISLCIAIVLIISYTEENLKTFIYYNY
jgi:D-alanyl-lipoteichoic acid acyltransferase DltB (MBOAT superfamily)